MSAPRRIPLADLAALLKPHREALGAAFDRVLTSGRFVLGPEVEGFERSLGAWVGAPHVVGTSSGTDALLALFLSEMALGRMQPGDEILTTPYTFISTATSVLRAGLRPVFADIDPRTLLLDPIAAARRVGRRTRGVVVVHLFGAPVEPASLDSICGSELALYEDAAQAIGARFADGRSVATAGRAGIFSFFPAKNLGALGDGGAVVTRDPALAMAVKATRQHGCHERYVHDHLGGNFRLDALQAAMLGALLPALDGWIAARRTTARALLARLSALPAARAGELALPPDAPGHAWNQFVVRTPRRDALRAALAARGIDTAVYYPAPVHVQPVLAVLGFRAGDLPEAERASLETLALPIAPPRPADHVDILADAVAAFFAGPCA